MVDVQTIGVLVTAASVSIAAIYYIMNIRETNKNRRVTLANTMMQTFISEEGSRRWTELWNMKWKDFDDFKIKYDSSHNPDNYAKRNAVWNTCDILGYMYESSIIDMETIFAISGPSVYITWEKFKPIIVGYRDLGEYSPIQYRHWEHLASDEFKSMTKNKVSQ